MPIIKMQIDINVPYGRFCSDSVKNCSFIGGEEMEWECSAFEAPLHSLRSADSLLKCPACLAACDEVKRKE